MKLTPVANVVKRLGSKRGVQSAECGKMRSVENSECGKCGVLKKKIKRLKRKKKKIRKK